MKKSKTMRIASLLLVLSLVTTCFVGTTFAKYTSSADATATATVAKWDVSVNNQKLTTANPTVAFNLFNTIYDSDGTTTEQDVKAGLIAPGTSGQFEFKVHNGSEVKAQYSIALSETNEKGVPIEYSADKTTWYPANSEDLKAALTGTLAVSAEDVTETVYWRWAFSPNAAADNADTAIGTATSTASVTVKATITVSQVD